MGRDADIVRAFGGSPDWVGVAPMSRSEAQDWISAQVDSGNAASWAVETDGRLIGSARLFGLVEDDRRASYAVGLLRRDLLGRGLGRVVTHLALDHAFGPLRLHRVALRVLASNQRAIRCYRACGFVEEGREREAAFVDGAWHDDLIMGVLAHEQAAGGA